MQRTGGRPAERVRLRTPGPPRELSGQINVTVSELAHDYIPSSHAELDRVLSSRSVSENSTRGHSPAYRPSPARVFSFAAFQDARATSSTPGRPERILDVMTFATLVHAIAHALGMAFAMFWEILWASAIHRIGCGRLLRAGRSCPRSPHACRA